MCCQITIPGRSIQNRLQHQTFAIEKFPHSIVPTRSCSGKKHLFKLLNTFSLCGRRVKFVESPKIKVFINLPSHEKCFRKKTCWLVSFNGSSLHSHLPSISREYNIFFSELSRLKYPVGYTNAPTRV